MHSCLLVVIAPLATATKSSVISIPNSALIFRHQRSWVQGTSCRGPSTSTPIAAHYYFSAATMVPGLFAQGDSWQQSLFPLVPAMMTTVAISVKRCSFGDLFVWYIIVFELCKVHSSPYYCVFFCGGPPSGCNVVTSRDNSACLGIYLSTSNPICQFVFMIHRRAPFYNFILFLSVSSCNSPLVNLSWFETCTKDPKTIWIIIIFCIYKKN